MEPQLTESGDASSGHLISLSEEQFKKLSDAMKDGNPDEVEAAAREVHPKLYDFSKGLDDLVENSGLTLLEVVGSIQIKLHSLLYSCLV